MAERLAYLEAVIGADITQFRKSMRDIRNETGFLSETISGLAGMARTATFAFTTPMVALGTYAGQAAMEFEANMYNINAIAGLTADALSDLSERTLEFGKTTREGAIGASEALYTVFSAGITNVEDAFSAMEVATYTAEAGLANITTTTEALVATMLSYGDTSEEMAWRSSNALTRMVAVGVGSMENFGNAIANVLPSAASLGMDVEELFGNLAFLTQRGLSASRAATAMNAALTALAKPTEAMQAAMRRLGVQGAEQLIEKFGGVNGALMALIETTDGTQAQIQAMFNNIRGARAINLFMSDMEGWKAMMDEFSMGLDTATMDAWNAQAESFAYAWDRMTAALQAVGITIGSAILPVVKPLVELFTDFLLSITELSDETIQFGVGLATVATFLPPIVWGFTSLAGVFLGLVSGVGGATVAIGLLLASSQTSFDLIKTAVMENMQPVIDSLAEARAAVEEFYAILFPPADTQQQFDPSTYTTRVNPADLIEVTQTTSLWDIFESRGYIEKMSWDEFMDAAIEGGWGGGAVEAGSTLNLNIEGVTVGNRTQMLQQANNLWKGEQDIWQAEPPNDFNSRLERAFDAALPKLQTAFTNFVNAFGAWVVTQGINIFDWAAQSLNSFDSDAFLAKFKVAMDALFRGDIVGAISAFAPDLGTSISGLFADVNIDFSGLSTSLGGFTTAVSDFILNKAIPSISNAIGFLTGRLAGMFYGAVKGGVVAATTLLQGGDAEDALAAMASYIGTNVIGEFESGFTEGIAGSELETDVRTFVDDIKEIFSGDTTKENGIANFFAPIGDFFDKAKEALGLDLSGFTDLGQGISNFVDDLASSDYSGLTTLLAIVGGATFIAFIEFMNFVARMGKVLGNVLSGFGDGLRILFRAFSIAATGDLAGAIGALGVSLLNFGFALLQLPVAMIDEVIGATARLLGIDFEGIGTWLEDVRQSINDALGFGDRIDLDEPLVVNVPVIPAVTIASQEDIMFGGEEAAFRNLENIVDLAGLEFNFSEDALGNLLISLPEGAALNFDEADVNSAVMKGFLEAVESGVYSGSGFEAMALAIYDSIKPQLDGAMGTTPLETEVPAEGVTVTLPPQPRATLENVDQFVSGVSEEVKKAVSDELTSNPPEVPLDVLAAAANRSESGTDFATNYIVPIATSIATNFGEGSPAIIALSGFNTEWKTLQDTISSTVFSENLTTLEGNFTTSLGNILATVQTNMPLIVAEFDKVKAAIADLTNMDLVITITGQYISPDGTPHSTGLGYVPYDGYQATLHKGEMVVPATVAGNIRRSESAAPTQQNNNIYISGVQNADELLRELRRRGIDLERRSGSR